MYDIRGFIIYSLVTIPGIFFWGTLSDIFVKKLSGQVKSDFFAVLVSGTVLYSLYILITGSLSGLNIFYIMLPCLMSLVFFREISSGSRFFWVRAKRYLFVKNIRIYYAMIFIVAGFSFLRLFGTRILGDSLVYHLYLPLKYVDLGRILRIPYSEHSLWPALGEMYFTVGLFFKSIPAAKMFSFFMFMALGAVTASLVRLITGSRVLSVIGTSVVMTTPAFFFYSSATYVDLALTVFIVSMIYFLMRYLSEGNIYYLVFSAVAAAGGLSCKYTAIIAIVAVVPVVLYIQAIKRKKADIFIFLSVLALLSFLWYFRSFWMTGNPVFPFADNIFGSGFSSEVPASKMSLLGRLVNTSTGHSMGSGRAFLDLVRMPFDMVFKSDLFGGEKIGVMYLLLMPFFFFGSFKSKANACITIFISLYVVQWFFLDQMLRFFFPVLPLLAAVSMVGVKHLKKNVIVKKAVFPVFIPVMFLQSSLSGYYCAQDLKYSIDGKERTEYLGYSYRLGKELEKFRSKEYKVLLVGSNDLFYLPGNTLRENTLRNFTGYDKEQDKTGYLDRLGIKIVVIHDREPGPGGKSSFDPIGYYKGLIGRKLKILERFKDEEDFIICEVLKQDG